MGFLLGYMLACVGSACPIMGSSWELFLGIFVGVVVEVDVGSVRWGHGRNCYSDCCWARSGSLLSVVVGVVVEIFGGNFAGVVV